MLPAQTLTRGFSARASKARSILARPVLRSTAPMEVVMRTSLRRSREAKRHRSRKHAFEIDFRCRTTDKGSQVRRAHLRWHKQPSLSQARVFCCPVARSEEHTSETQSLMRIPYAVFCLKKKKKYNTKTCTILN